MQIIINATELASSSKLNLAVLRALPKCGEARNAIEMIESEMGEITNFLATPKEQREGLMVATALNEKLGGLTVDWMSIRWISNTEDHLALSVTMCEEKLIEINEILEENVGTLVGIGITMYGLIRTFGGTLIQIGKRIEKALK